MTSISLKYISNRAVVCFFVILLVVSVVWNNYTMPLNFAIISCASVLLFFYGINIFGRKWNKNTESVILKNVILLAFLIRIIWSVFVYYFNVDYFGSHVGSEEDTVVYIELGEECANGFRNFDLSFFNKWFNSYHISIDDIGEPIFLGCIYFITGSISDVFIPFVVKSFLGAYTCVLMYKIAKSHFGENIAKVTALFCMFNPNMIWWCACMMKETEMLFFVVLYIYMMDNVIIAKKFNLNKLIIASILGMYLFLFRSALGVVAFASAGITLMLSKIKGFTVQKKIVAGLMILTILSIGIGETMISRTKTMIEQVQSDGQEQNMIWRSQRVDNAGNVQTFAKYASATVFAPLIFTIPFPTVTSANAAQFSQMQMSGGNYIKNILSAFVIFYIFTIFINREWKKHVLLLSFMIVYLFVLVMSGYAQSGRFHMPVWSFEMMFAACGICTFPKNKRHWFKYLLIFEFVACIAWNWFKLKGRGLI